VVKLTIGQLAKQANVNVETIRYYQRVGLLEQPSKPVQGFREYSEKEVEKVLFIKRAQQLSFSLAEIKQLMLVGKSDCTEVAKLTTIKRNKLKRQIGELNVVYDELNRLIAACESTNDNCLYTFFDLLAIKNLAPVPY
jgi:MerR family transcriptional regulator, mercuric resistance operon regulatory protein